MIGVIHHTKDYFTLPWWPALKGEENRKGENHDILWKTLTLMAGEEAGKIWTLTHSNHICDKTPGSDIAPLLFESTWFPSEINEIIYEGQTN